MLDRTLMQQDVSVWLKLKVWCSTDFHAGSYQLLVINVEISIRIFQHPSTKPLNRQPLRTKQDFQVTTEHSINSKAQRVSRILSRLSNTTTLCHLKIINQATLIPHCSTTISSSINQITILAALANPYISRSRLPSVRERSESPAGLPLYWSKTRYH